MSKIERMAAMFATEMVEHNLMNGATRLDLDYIATEACELAYMIHEKSKQYKEPKQTKTLSRSDVAAIVESELKSKEHIAKPNQPHYPQ